MAAENLTVDLMVRRAQAADAASLRALWSEAAEMLVQVDPRYRLAPAAGTVWETALHGWLAREDMAIFVVEQQDGAGGKMLGYIVGALEPGPPGFLPARYGFVSDLAVDPHAGRGSIGRLLLDALREWFRAQGVAHIEARVPARHAVAQAFWRAVGASKLYEQMWIRLNR